MEKIAKIIGNRIRYLRAKRNITQEELAFRSKLHTAHIGRIERGHENPTVETLDKIITALEIEYKAFYDFDNLTNTAEYTRQNRLENLFNNLSVHEQEEVFKVFKKIIDIKKN